MGLFSFLSRKSEQRNNTEQSQQPQCAQQGSSVKNLFSFLDKGGNAMSLSPVFCAVNIISNSCALLPWYAYDKDGSELSNLHYLNHLFDNAVVGRFLSIKGVVKDVLTNGNGFMYIERNSETGKPENLRYLPANTVNVFKNELENKVYYQCTNVSLNSKYIAPENMLHFKMYSNDGLVGIGVLDYAFNTIELSKNTEKATSDYMASGGAVTGILTPNNTNPNIPTTQKQIDNIRSSWENARSKSGTSTIILPADMKFTQLSANAKDAAYLDTRLFNLQEVARWFNISPLLLGDLSHSQYGNLESSQREFVLHTLQPYIVMIEDELNRKLIMPSKIGKEYIDLDENALLAADKVNQANYLSTLTQRGIITINEARAEIGFAPVEGGDELFVAYTDISQNTINDDGEDEDNEKQDNIENKEENNNEEQ